MLKVTVINAWNLFYEPKECKRHFYYHNYELLKRLSQKVQRFLSSDIHLHKGTKQLLNLESLKEQEAKVSDAFPIDLLSQLGKKKAISENHLRLRCTTLPSKRSWKLNLGIPRSKPGTYIDWQAWLVRGITPNNEMRSEFPTKFN